MPDGNRTGVKKELPPQYDENNANDQRWVQCALPLELLNISFVLSQYQKKLICVLPDHHGGSYILWDSFARELADDWRGWFVPQGQTVFEIILEM